MIVVFVMRRIRLVLATVGKVAEALGDDVAECRVRIQNGSHSILSR